MSLTLYPSSILKLNKLCLPSKLYLAFSIIILLFSLFSQSIFNIIKFGIIIAFWTWNLNIICKAGYKNITWVLLVFTFIMAFNPTVEPLVQGQFTGFHHPLKTIKDVIQSKLPINPLKYKYTHPSWTKGSYKETVVDTLSNDGWTQGMVYDEAIIQPYN